MQFPAQFRRGVFQRDIKPANITAADLAEPVRPGLHRFSRTLDTQPPSQAAHRRLWVRHEKVAEGEPASGRTLSEKTEPFTWIGWSISTQTWTISIPADKVTKITDQVSVALHSPKISIKVLQSLVGRLLWVTSAWKHLRPLLIPLYKDIIVGVVRNLCLNRSLCTIRMAQEILGRPSTWLPPGLNGCDLLLAMAPKLLQPTTAANQPTTASKLHMC